MPNPQTNRENTPTAPVETPEQKAAREAAEAQVDAVRGQTQVAADTVKTQVEIQSGGYPEGMEFMSGSKLEEVFAQHGSKEKLITLSKTIQGIFVNATNNYCPNIFDNKSSQHIGSAMAMIFMEKFSTDKNSGGNNANTAINNLGGALTKLGIGGKGPQDIKKNIGSLVGTFTNITGIMGNFRGRVDGMMNFFGWCEKNSSYISDFGSQISKLSNTTDMYEVINKVIANPDIKAEEALPISGNISSDNNKLLTILNNHAEQISKSGDPKKFIESMVSYSTQAGDTVKGIFATQKELQKQADPIGLIAIQAEGFLKQFGIDTNQFKNIFSLISKILGFPNGYDSIQRKQTSNNLGLSGENGKVLRNKIREIAKSYNNFENIKTGLSTIISSGIDIFPKTVIQEYIGDEDISIYIGTDGKVIEGKKADLASKIQERLCKIESNTGKTYLDQLQINATGNKYKEVDFVVASIFLGKQATEVINSGLFYTLKVLETQQETNAQTTPGGEIYTGTAERNKHITPTFRNKVKAFATKIGADYLDIMTFFYVESSASDRFSPRSLNASTGAAGIFQLMPDTASSMGINYNEFKDMTIEQQFDVFENIYYPKTYDMIKSQISNKIRPADLYLMIFYPDAVGKPLDHVISSKGSSVYNVNSGLDQEVNRQKDGKITVGDIQQMLNNKKQEFLQGYNDGGEYAGGADYKNPKRITHLNGDNNINYGTDNTFKPSKGTGTLDCVGYLKYIFSDGSDNRLNNTKIKYTEYWKVLPTQTNISGYMTAEKFKNGLSNNQDILRKIQVGDIVGIGKIYDEISDEYKIKRIDKKVDMHHGGVVSKIDRDIIGNITNIYMTHSTGSGNSGKGPAETALFGPNGYYKPNSNDSNTLVFGTFQG